MIFRGHDGRRPPEALRRFEAMVERSCPPGIGGIAECLPPGAGILNEARTSAGQASESATAAVVWPGGRKYQPYRSGLITASARAYRPRRYTKSRRHQPARRRLLQPERRQPASATHRKHLKRMQMPPVLLRRFSCCGRQRDGGTEHQHSAGASETAAKTSKHQAAPVPVMQVRQPLRRQRRKRRQPHQRLEAKTSEQTRQRRKSKYISGQRSNRLVISITGIPHAASRCTSAHHWRRKSEYCCRVWQPPGAKMPPKRAESIADVISRKMPA